MIDKVTQQPIRVQVPANSGPYIRVSLDQLAAVQQVLQVHGIPHWVRHQAISLDGQPFVVVINVGYDADPKKVQEVLDRAE